MKTLFSQLKLILLALLIAVGVSYVSAAWSNPTATPPEGNVAAPINVSEVGQTKKGNLILESLDANNNVLANALTLVNGNLLIQNGAIELKPNAGAGKVLTSDANGVGTWQSGSGGGIQPKIYKVGSAYSIPKYVPNNLLPASQEIYDTKGNLYKTLTPFGNFPGGWSFYADPITANKVCSSIFPDAPYINTMTKSNYSSPKDNRSVKWDGIHWVVTGGTTHMSTEFSCTSIETISFTTLLK